MRDDRVGHRKLYGGGHVVVYRDPRGQFAGLALAWRAGRMVAIRQCGSYVYYWGLA